MKITLPIFAPRELDEMMGLEAGDSLEIDHIGDGILRL